MSSEQSEQHTRQSTSNSHRASTVGTPGADNYYHLLNVPYDATKGQITKAYRQSMMRAHPDRAHPSRRAAAEELARLLNLAYATLSDSAKRNTYDESIRIEALQGEIMGRYVSGIGGQGFGGPNARSAEAPKRTMTERERREQNVSNRSAMITIFSAFGLVAVAGIGLLLLFALISLTLAAFF